MKKLRQLLIVSVLVILSACSSEGDNPIPEIEAEGTLSAAFEGTTDGAIEVSGENSTDTTSGGSGTPTETETVGSGESGANPVDTGQSTSPASSTPAISFQGTSLSGSFEVDDPIVLDASYSTIDTGELISFEWEQIDNGKPMVTLANANTATASFPATYGINGLRLAFKVTVTSSGGSTSTNTLNFSWSVNAPETGDSTNPGNNPPPAIGNGYYVMEQTGGFFAESAESVFVANQVNFNIDHINPDTNTILSSYPQAAMPTELAYVESTRSLYAALSAAGTLTRIDLDAGTQTTIAISGEALSLDGHDGRLYYTVDNTGSGSGYDLFSVGNDNVPTSHGTIEGNLIKHNPVTDELVAVRSGLSPSTVYRYSLTATTSAVELQNSRDLGSNAQDVAISADGLQLAVVAGGGNGAGYTIHDIQASDLTVSSGAWDTGAFPTAGDFSGSGTWFIATDRVDLILFDASTHVELDRYNVDESLCGLNYDKLDPVLFSHDSKHFFGKLTCGFDGEKSVLFYHTVP